MSELAAILGRARGLIGRGRATVQGLMVHKGLTVGRVVVGEVLVVSVVAVVVYLFLVDPLLPALTGELEARERMQTEREVRRLASDVRELRALRARVEVKSVTREELPHLLRGLAGGHAGLELTSMATRAAAAPAEDEAVSDERGSPGRGFVVDLSLKGDYGDLVRYVRMMEEAFFYRLLSLSIAEDGFELSIEVLQL